MNSLLFESGRKSETSEMKVGAGDVPVFLRNRVSPQLGRAREAWTEDELSFGFPLHPPPHWGETDHPAPPPVSDL